MLRSMLSICLSLFFTYYTSAQNNQSKPCACCTEEYRQFDFWLGNWEAFSGEKLAGKNRIVSLQDSCIMQENWVSANGQYTGTSYNYYNTQTKTWHQTWIDNQGGSLELNGKLEDGKMILWSGEMTNPQGKKYINRITWTPNKDGTVRQHWEASTDDGKTWQTAFDGMYKRSGK